MIKLSIIIVNYKVEEKLLKCVNSIVASNLDVPYEIIVVDNDKESNLSNKLKNHKQIRYIKSPKNLGFGGGNNLGARHAKGEYLFFLNPDTLIINNAVEKLYEFIKSDKEIGIVSPLLVNNNLESFNTQSRKELTPINAIYSLSFLRKFFSKKNIYNDNFLKHWDKKSTLEVDTVPGAALMLSKTLFEKVKGFDERFFLYFEENDLSKRIKNLGLKLFIYPDAKIVHLVGQSTKQIKTRDSYFEKSRFYYFKKHYGVLKAIFTELILRINKNLLILCLILLTSLYLRLVNLSISMPFIGDQGWFYLSARDLLINGKIPLVGIASSHLWLHQGPLWTYMLSVALFLGKFNPISGAILTAMFGLGSTYLIYKLGLEIFSKRIGLIAACFYAVSPLIVFFERMPFDPSIIPFFTILYFYAIFKWVNNNIKFFPITLFLLAILYNLELATFSLLFPLLLIFIYGFLKRKSFVVKLFTPKLIIYSLILLIIPMIPVLIYDFSNGYKQTVIFLGWVFVYKPFSSILKYSQDMGGFNISDVANFLLINIQKIIFQSNFIISMFIFASSFIFIVKDLVKKKYLLLGNPNLLLILFLAIGILGILINKTPSDAYLPILFPFVIYMVAIFFDKLLSIKSIKYASIFIIFILLSINFYSSFKNTLKPDYQNRITAADKIISLVKNEKYNLIGKGEGSWFESFTMNYEYLLWWKGYPVSKTNQKLKVIVKEDKTGIYVYKL